MAVVRGCNIRTIGDRQADLVSEEAIQFADSVLGPAELADAGCLLPEVPLPHSRCPVGACA